MTDGLGRGRPALDKKEGEKSKSSIFGWILNHWTPTSQILASHPSLDEYGSDVHEFDHHWMCSMSYTPAVTYPTTPVMDLQHLLQSTVQLCSQIKTPRLLLLRLLLQVLVWSCSLRQYLLPYPLTKVVVLLMAHPRDQR